MATGRFLPLGEGDVDLEAARDALVEVGYDGWVLVELDSYDGDPAESARISKTVLDQLFPASS